MSAVLAVVERQPTRWGPALALTSAFLGLAVAGWLLMLRGWRSRQRRQADLPPLPLPVAAAAEQLVPAVTGLYVGTTGAGGWLDRLAVHGLSDRAQGRLALTADGVTVERQATAPFRIPAAALRSARLDAALAGKVVGDGRLLVLTWDHGGRRLDTGFRSSDPEAAVPLLRAVQRLVAGRA